MSFADFFSRRKQCKEHPLKIKNDANKESRDAMKKIKDYIDKYINNAKDEDIIEQISKNPDLVIKDIISYAIQETQKSNAFTTQRMINSITEDQRIDSSDMTVSLMIVNERNQMIEQLNSVNHLSLISKEKKQVVASIIVRLIGTCDAIHHVSKISNNLHYGWENYFDIDTDIKLSKINSIIYEDHQKIFGKTNFGGDQNAQDSVKFIEDDHQWNL